MKLPDELKEWISGDKSLAASRIAQVRYQFAEAIVRHCAKVCDDLTIPTEWCEGAVRSYRSPTAQECAAAILREFGIEP